LPTNSILKYCDFIITVERERERERERELLTFHYHYLVRAAIERGKRAESRLSR
jgi:hypothetical protein